MTACTATAPIDIPTKGNANMIAGTFNCVYDANMLSGAAVSLSEDLTHLVVKCSASNSSKVSFYTAGIYTPTEVRIYSPSLHTYNGSKADAELLIVHSIVSSNTDTNVSSNGLIVSVPISLGTNSRSSSSTPDFDAIIQAANTLNASTIALNSSAPINQDVNVNAFIPAKPYYVYYGTLPYDSCGGNYYYAVFTDPISATGPINNVVSSGIKTAPQPLLLQKSKGGPTTLGSGSGSTDEYVLYEMVDTGDSDATNASSSSSSASSSSSSAASFTTGMNVIWGIVISLVLGLLYWLLKRIDIGGAISAISATNNPSDLATNA